MRTTNNFLPCRMTGTTDQTPFSLFRAQVIDMRIHMRAIILAAGIGKRLVRIGLQDTYAHGASRPYLMREYGLDAIALVAQVEKMVGEDLKISHDDLDAVRLEAVHSDAKAEAL